MRNRYLLVLVVLAACHGATPDSFRIDALYASASGNGAFAIVGTSDTHAYAVAHLDEHGHATWKRSLQCGAVGEVTADDRIVVARCETLSATNTFVDHVAAFSAEDGRELWSHDESLGEGGVVGGVHISPAGVLVTTAAHATVFERQTGAIRLVRSIDAAQPGPRSGGSAFVFVGPTVAALEPVSNTASAGPGIGLGCVDGDEYFEVANGVVGSRPLSHLDVAATSLVLPLRSGRPVALIACGRYRSDRIFELYVNIDGKTSIHVVRISASGALVADIDLEAPRPANSNLTARYPDVVDLNGVLPRFNLIAVLDGLKSRLVMVDLEAAKIGEVVATSIEDDNIFRSHGKWFVSRGQRLTIFDAETGTRIGERRFGGGVAAVGPSDIGPARIWLRSTQGQALAVLSGSLDVLYRRGITVETP